MTILYWPSFCAEKLILAEFTINVSENFTKPGVGQEYIGTSLIGSTLSGTQKYALQELLNHVYSPLLETKKIYTDLEPTAPGWMAARDAVDVLNSALQIAIWEIIHESTDENWNMGNWNVAIGNFKVHSPQKLDESASLLSANEMYSEILRLTDSWFAGINTGIWPEQFSRETLFELTYYTSDGDLSQPLLLAVLHPPSSDVPEPATILLWTLGTLGTAGASWVRKRTSRKIPAA